VKLEDLYLKLPLFLQQVAFNLEGWRVKRRNFGGRFPEFLREYERRSFWTSDQIQTYRDSRLSAVIRHAWETVPFYRRRWQELDIRPEDIRTLKDLAMLPILTKDEVKQHAEELVSTAVPKRNQVHIKTSGTTGGGLRFVTTKDAVQEQWAVWWRYRGWHGIPLDAWSALFTGRSLVPLSQTQPPFWRVNYPGRKIHFSAYHMSPENLPSYLEELRRRQPPWLHGYPSLLALLASYILEHQIDLGYQSRWITVGAENLLPQQTSLIQHAFGVRPLQHYGMAEAVANISECEYGNLHVDEDFAAVEFLPNQDGPGYRVIGTNLSNLAFPFIRYDVQDLVNLDENDSCPCGRPGRLVQNLDGRQEDYVILHNGVKLGRLDHIFKDLINIREAQIYQKVPGEMVVRIVPGSHYAAEDEKALRHEINKRVGEETKVEITYVNNLAKSKTGKLRFVISDLDEGKIG
jgi:phenylacetate-CoA ligase